MNKNILTTEHIMERRYSISDDLYGIMFLVCYGLVSRYGEVYRPIIENIIRNTQVYIDNLPLVEIIEENGFDPEDIYGGEDLNNSDFSTVAASFPGDDVWFDKDKNVHHYKDSPIVFCSMVGRNYNELLNALIHEFLHLLKGSINNLETDNGYFSIRSGLNKYGMGFGKDGKQFEFCTDSVIDEVINVYDTTDAMIEIGKLDSNDLHPVVKIEFDKLDLRSIDDAHGYEYGVFALRNLWANPVFKDLIGSNIVEGNIDTIKSEFDSIAGYDAFDSLSDYLETLEYSTDEDERDIISSYITGIIDSYNLGTMDMVKKKN